MVKFHLAIFDTQPPHLYFGGVERRIMETTKRMQTEAEVTVYCGTKAGFKTPITINGVKLEPCYSTDLVYPLDNWFFNRSLLKTNGAYKANIYEAHNVSGYGFPETLKKRGINKPFIHVVHGPLADEYQQAQLNHQSFKGRLANHFMKKLAEQEKKTAHQATLIVAVSKYSVGKIVQNYQVDEAKIRIVPNGVDVEKFKPSKNPAAARQQFGLGAEPCVLFVGGLVPRKGLPYLVEAAKTVIKDKPEVKFLIVGDGPEKPQLTNAIAKAKLEGNFRFFAKLKDEALPVIYNCADVFVLPSIQEGQGIVLLEAQASGVPVVAFASGGVKEAVRDGETSLLVKPGDTDALAEALIKLLNDKLRRLAIGRNGQSFVAENYTWDVCTQKMLQVYREALSMKR